MSENYVSTGNVSVMAEDFAQRHFLAATKPAAQQTMTPATYVLNVKRYSRAAQDIIRNPDQSPMLTSLLARLPSELQQLMSLAPDREEVSTLGMLNEIMQVLFSAASNEERVTEQPFLPDATYAAWRSMIAACSKQNMLTGMVIDLTRRELGNQRHPELEAVNILRVLNRAAIPYPGLQENLLRSFILNPSDLPGMIRNADIGADHYDAYTADMLSEASASAKKALATSIIGWVQQLQHKEKYVQAARLIHFLAAVDHPQLKKGETPVPNAANRPMAVHYTDQQFGDIKAPMAFLRPVEDEDDRIVFVIDGKKLSWNETWELAETTKDQRGRSLADRMHGFMFKVQDDLMPVPDAPDKTLRKTFRPATTNGFQFDATESEAPTVTALVVPHYEAWDPDASGANGEKAAAAAAKAKDKPPIPEGGAVILAFPAGPRAPKPGV